MSCHQDYTSRAAGLQGLYLGQQGYRGFIWGRRARAACMGKKELCTAARDAVMNLSRTTSRLATTWGMGVVRVWHEGRARGGENAHMGMLGLHHLSCSTHGTAAPMAHTATPMAHVCRTWYTRHTRHPRHPRHRWHTHDTCTAPMARGTHGGPVAVWFDGLLELAQGRVREHPQSRDHITRVAGTEVLEAVLHCELQ